MLNIMVKFLDLLDKLILFCYNNMRYISKEPFRGGMYFKCILNGFYYANLVLEVSVCFLYMMMKKLLRKCF